MINLELRQIPFEEELEQMNLPSDAGKLIELLVKERRDILEHKYDMVFIYTQLKNQSGEFWADYDCNSVEELLTKFNLPLGTTLGRWEALVALFPKETIVTIGSESLFTLTLLISKVQENADERKNDYENIFKIYNKDNIVFNNTSFLRTVYEYINDKYKTDSKKPDSRPNNLSPIGSTLKIVTEKTSADEPLQIAVGYREDKTLQDALAHISMLEGRIKELGGKVPVRPRNLQEKRPPNAKKKAA